MKYIDKKEFDKYCINIWSGPYLYERVPVCNGFPGVRQHFIPVVASQTLSLVAHPAHSDHFIVSNPVDSKEITNGDAEMLH